jgi:uncharacterized membrane protein
VIKSYYLSFLSQAGSSYSSGEKAEMESIVLLLILFLLCWLAVTIYNFIAIHKMGNRLSGLESAVSRLRTQIQALSQPEKPPVEALQRASEPELGLPIVADADTAAPPGISAAEIINIIKPLPDVPSHPVRPVGTKEDRLDYLERLVGTRWLNWVGALVTLAGTAFLLKFLYDRGWIGPAGRVSIGMGIGVALLYLGEVKLRKLHDLFSQSVSAAGCGALFLTTFLSFKFYEFSGPTWTFALLCWFALFAVALAVVRRGLVLAFLGLICAYLSPWLLSTGQDQAEALFAYLAIVALAVAVVNAMRDWRGIVSLSFVFSWIYYVGWFSRFYTTKRLPIATIGAVGLILLTGSAALVRGLRNNKTVRLEECIVIAAAFVSGLYFLWDILSAEHALMLGFVLCGLTLVTLGALNAATRKNASNPVLESTLLGFASGSLLLVIPACFEADGAMLAWALAAVIFADMGARAGRILLEAAAGFCLLAGLWVGLFQGVSHTGVFIPVANNVFLAWFGIILAWFIVGFRHFRMTSESSYRKSAGLTLQIAASFMLIGLLSYEVIAWFRGQIQYAGSSEPFLKDWRIVVLCILWAFYPWLWLSRAKAQPRLRELSSIHYGVLGFALLLLLPDFHHRDTLVFLNPIFPASLLLPAGIFFLASKIDENRKMIKPGLQVFAHLLCVILLAVELNQGLYLSGWSASIRDWVRMALISVAWASYATILLWIGISRNLKSWRWLALCLLGATLVKVLFLDMAEVRQIWRVLSFMGLGALLMICSYAYSRRERMKQTVNIPDKR